MERTWAATARLRNSASHPFRGPEAFGASAREARFSFSSSEEGSSFKCSLDKGAFTTCSNPQDYSGLADREHTFQVQATDRLGNVRLSAEYRWVVDNDPPEQPAISIPKPKQRLSAASTVFSGTAEPGSTVWVLVDGVQVGGEVKANTDGHWESHELSLPDGRHRATVKATDKAGNDSVPSMEVSFDMGQRSHYGMDCAAGPSALAPWGLLLVGLLRRRSRPSR